MKLQRLAAALCLATMPSLSCNRDNTTGAPAPTQHRPTSQPATPKGQHQMGTLRTFPATFKSLQHTVEFNFSISVDLPPSFPQDLTEDSKALLHSVINMVREEFTTLDKGESINPFTTGTILNVSPRVLVEFGNITKTLSTLRIPDLGSDAMTIAAAKKGQPIQYLMIFDFARLKIKAEKIAAQFNTPWTEAFLPVLAMSCIHEVFGHFPMSLAEKERTDYIANERLITPRGIRGFERYIEIIKQQIPDSHPDKSTTINMLHAVLASEHALQEQYH